MSQAPPADKRRAILDAAITVFARQGFHSARVSDVAASLGVVIAIGERIGACEGSGARAYPSSPSARWRMISSRSASRLRRRVSASRWRRRSVSFSATSGGTGSGLPCSSTATMVR